MCILQEQLGSLCNLSPNYISDMFHKEFGMGALQYFQLKKLISNKPTTELFANGVSLGVPSSPEQARVSLRVNW